MANHTFGESNPLPPGSITFSDMTWNKTGGWRYLRPRFVKKVAPCNEACPAGNDIQGFMSLAGQGRFNEALQSIIEENPFPAVCGRVCYHPCENACNRRILDEPLSIQAVERFVGDVKLDETPQRAAARSERTAVVGAGPAGLTCAYHLSRLGYQVRIFEKAPLPGGMLRQGIPVYRLPRKTLDREIARIMGMGIELQSNCRVGRDVSWEELRLYKAVFLAVGAQKPVSPELAGSRGDGLMAGTDFLRKVNENRYIAPAKRVAVIGGGNTAIDCARAALRLGAKSTVVYRRDRDQMPAIREEVEEALEEGVEFQWSASPFKIKRAKGKVKELVCVRNELVPDEDGGRPRPVPIEGSEFTVKADLVLTAVGEGIDPADLPPDLALSEGVVEIDSLGATGMPNMWAGGDVTSDMRMVVHAIGAGKRAALAIHAHLAGLDPDELAERAQIGETGSYSMERLRIAGTAEGGAYLKETVGSDRINLDHFEPVERTPVPTRPAKDRRRNFEEVVRGFTREQVEQETARCFQCGACDGCGICLTYCPDFSIVLGTKPGTNAIDIDHCKGCGICAQECPRSAVVMERE